jgi:metal-sulfur cluster biosynthetic enzyme
MNKPQDTPNHAVWDIESSHPEMLEPFKARMREVVDPEIGLDVIALGLVRNVTINDGDAQIYMILTTPYCPYGPAMIEMTRRKAEEALGLPTAIKLGLEMWDFSMMEEGAMPEWGMW